MESREVGRRPRRGQPGLANHESWLEASWNHMRSGSQAAKQPTSSSSSSGSRATASQQQRDRAATISRLWGMGSL